MENLKVEYISLADIKTYEKNAKNHPESQIQQIARSIERFGFVNPVLLDENNILIAGHGRVAAAHLLEMDKVPVIQLIGLSDAQKRAYRLADNKIAENGGWNLDILKMEICELEVICEDFDITDAGFGTLEIDSLFVEKVEKEKSDAKGNAVPFIPDNEIITKPGDIWYLGQHRIICGDSLKEESYENLMRNERASLVLTDAPYNVSAASIGNSGKQKHEQFAMAAGEMSKDEFTKFLIDCMTLCAKYSTPTALGYYWMDWRHIEEIMTAGRTAYPLFVNLCVWAKVTGGMGKLYRSAHELCFIFGKDKHYLDNVELGKHGRYRTNVWNFAGVNSFGVHKDDLKFHPTVKPYEMFKEAILDCTPRGEIVLDAFLGSGTTMIAAEKACRVCYGIEFEPRYVDTAIRRMQDLFGIEAIHADTGKFYNDLLTERRKENR